MKRIRVNGGALKAKRESIDGLTQRGLARLAASHLAATPDGERLAASFQTAASTLERGAAGLMGADRLDAIAAALCCDVRDLTEPVRWGLRDDEGRLVAPGGVLVVTSVYEEAYRLHGLLMGANGQLPAQVSRSKPAALFASDRDGWIAENFDDLDDAEREHVTVVDASYGYLRALWHLDVAATSPAAGERRLAVEAGLVRAMSAPELAEVGEPAALALDLIEQAHVLAARRLTCDRLRDAPAPVYAAWVTEARNLSEAVDLARGLVESAEIA